MLWSQDYHWSSVLLFVRLITWPSCMHALCLAHPPCLTHPCCLLGVLFTEKERTQTVNNDAWQAGRAGRHGGRADAAVLAGRDTRHATFPRQEERLAEGLAEVALLAMAVWIIISSTRPIKLKRVVHAHTALQKLIRHNCDLFIDFFVICLYSQMTHDHALIPPRGLLWGTRGTRPPDSSISSAVHADIET